MKRLKFIIWIGIMLLSWSGVLNELTSQGTWKYYTTADGLAHDHVWCINQDRDGNYWFGTKKGLTKFDTNGVWTSYLTEFGNPRVDNEVWVMDLEFDSLNHKWIVAGGDFTAVNQSVGNYVIHFDDTTFTWYNPAEGSYSIQSPRCVGKDSSGTILVGMDPNYIWGFDRKTWQVLYGVGEIYFDSVNDIKMDRNKKLCFAHDSGFSWFFNVKLDRNKKLDFVPEASVSTQWDYIGIGTSSSIRRIAFDRQNRLWCATQHAGLRMLERENHTFTFKDIFYDQTDGLLSNICHTVAIDSTNAIWIGTPFGAQRFDRKNWLTFTRENGLIHDSIWDILVDQHGDVWFGTSGGVSVFHDTSHTTTVKSLSTASTRMPDFQLQNYPNPFNTRTTIRYFLPVPRTVKLVLYNLRSQIIMEYAESFQSAGPHEIIWDGRGQSGKEVSSGVYYAVLRGNSAIQTIKMCLIR
jgi:hypothetical protein